MNNEVINEIKKLQEEIRELCDTDENKRREEYWEDFGTSEDYRRGIPKEKEPVTFTVEMEREGYSKALGFSLVDFYKDPYSFILNSLKIIIFKYKNFNDCTPVGKEIAYYPGVGFEKSIFGGESLYSDKDAWLARQDILKERVKIESLEYPDFYKSGNMPETHKFYEQLTKIVDKDFNIVFPQWSRGSWGLAWQLRGFENILIDTADDYQWVVQFLDYLTKARENWIEQRSKFLKAEISICNIYNDEVTYPVVYPKLYKELIRPTEIEMSNFSGGVMYWHSCGNTTPLQTLINEIPNLHMVHVSPWSDLGNAVKSFDTNIALEVALHGYSDVISPASVDVIDKKLNYINETTKTHKATIRADGIQIVGDVENDLQQIKNWINRANEVLL